MERDRGQMIQQKDTSLTNTWNTYEAILNNVRFEWDDHLHQGEQICKHDCTQYLDTYFTGYKMKKFYLKKEHATFK